MTTSLLLFLHLAGAAFWVGGMAFAVLVARPALGSAEPPVRVKVLAGMLSRFLQGVLIAIVVQFVTGIFLLLPRGGMANAGPAIHAMIALAIAMVVVYVIVRVQFGHLRQAAARGDLPTAARAAECIRRLVWLNLVLGLAALAAGAFAR